MAPPTQYYNMSVNLQPGPDVAYTISATGLNDTITATTFANVVTLQFTCEAAETATTYIAISVPGYDEIGIFFQHQCQHPSTFNVGQDTFIPSIVVDGAVKRDLQPLVVNPGENFSKFWVWLSDSVLPPQQYAVTVDGANLYGLETTVTYANGQTAYDKSTSIFQPISGFNIFYDCPFQKKKNQTHSLMDVHISFGWKDVFTFQVMKICGVPPNPRLGLMIGTAKNGGDVASEGVIQPGFDEAQPAIYHAGMISQSFYMWLDMNKTIGDEQNFLVEFLVEDPSVLNIVGNDLVGTIKMDGPTAKDTILKLDLLCYRPGNTSAIIMVKFDQAWDPVEIYLNKTCMLPELDVGYASTGGTLTPDVVHHNVVVGTELVVAESELTTKFNVWIPHSWAERSAPYQQFEVVTIGYDRMFVSPLDGLTTTDRAVPADPGAILAGIYVTYRCESPPERSTSTLNLTLNVGWVTPLTWEWTKKCGPQPQPGHSSGWSPFGIFAFTVFIIILVWCLGGCAYNYIRKDQRGAEAIPGITLFRACYHRCFPAPRYTPQTDYNYDKAPDYGGTSYQSEL